jgi:hypothetical protein
MARLRKFDVETLIDAIDSPLLIDALRNALAQILQVDRFDDDWPALVRLAGHRAGWTGSRLTDLIRREPDALIALALELNEQRDIA